MVLPVLQSIRKRDPFPFDSFAARLKRKLMLYPPDTVFIFTLYLYLSIYWSFYPPTYNIFINITLY